MAGTHRMHTEFLFETSTKEEITLMVRHKQKDVKIGRREIGGVNKHTVIF